MSYMGKGPHQLETHQFLRSYRQAPPTLMRNQTLIVNPAFQLVGLTKVANRVGRDQSACAAQKPLKSWVLHQKCHSEPSF